MKGGGEQKAPLGTESDPRPQLVLRLGDRW